MYKISTRSSCGTSSRMQKVLLVMKLMTTMLLLSILQVSAETYAQKLTMNREAVSIRQVFKEIRKQTGFNVLWKSDMLDASSLIHVRFIESPLEEVMQTCLQGTGMTYTVDDKPVVLRRKHQSRTDVTGVELSQPPREIGRTSCGERG